MKVIVFGLLIVLVLSFWGYGCSLRPLEHQSNNQDSSTPNPATPIEINSPGENEPQASNNDEPVTELPVIEEEIIDLKDLIVMIDDQYYAVDGNSIGVIVNKNIKLPDGYVPIGLYVPDIKENPHNLSLREVLKDDLNDLLMEARALGFNLVIQSAYRSFDRQKAIYDRSVSANGKDYTEKYIAFPGTSEHQTGLAIDFSSPKTGYSLDETFGTLDEGKWLRDNSYMYGFILRYPKGKESITGYNFEPWHFRYVGREMAKNIFESGLTLEEYYGLVD